MGRSKPQTTPGILPAWKLDMWQKTSPLDPDKSSLGQGAKTDNDLDNEQEPPEEVDGRRDMKEQRSRPRPLVAACHLQTRLCVPSLPEQHDLGGAVERELQPDKEDVDAPEEKLGARGEAKVPPAKMDGGEDNDGECEREVLGEIRGLPVAIVGRAYVCVRRWVDCSRN